MQENARLEALRRSADPALVAAIEEVIESGKDSDLCRIDPIQFATARGLSQEATLDAFIRDVTEPVVTNAAVQGLLSANSLRPTTHRALLRGIADELTVYEIP